MLPPVRQAYRRQTLLHPFLRVGLAAQQERERDVLARRPRLTQRRASRPWREREVTACAGAVSKEENSRHAERAGHDLALGLSHRLRGLQAASSGPPASLLLPGLLGDDPAHRWPSLPPVRTPVRLAARADLQSGTPLRPLPEKTSRVRPRPLPVPLRRRLGESDPPVQVPAPGRAGNAPGRPDARLGGQAAIRLPDHARPAPSQPPARPRV